jgi:ketosteroid isomerase-like protein
MSELKNRAFALLNAWTTGDVSELAGFIAPQFEEIDRPEATAVGLDGLQAKLALFHKVHTNITLNVRKQIVDGDLVCTQWIMTATVRAPDAAEGGGQEVVYFPGISWTYFADGKIVKNRQYRDVVGYLQQRGYTWAPAGAANLTASEAQA